MAMQGKHTVVHHRLRALIPYLYDRTAVLPWHTAMCQHLRAHIPKLCVHTAVLSWHMAVSEGLRVWPTDHVVLY